MHRTAHRTAHSRLFLHSAIVALIVPSLASVACAQATGTQTAGTPPTVSSADGRAAPTETVLRPGDQIRLIVWRGPEFTGDYRIAPDGTIQHPLLREVVASGVPLSLVRSRIATVLAQHTQEPQFVMEALVQVVVGGEVRAPGLYALPPESPIMAAVVQSGGVTPEGRLSRVLLIRDGQERELDLTAADQRDARSPVQSGDQILVRSGRSIVRDYVVPISSVLGAVGWIVTLLVDRQD